MSARPDLIPQTAVRDVLALPSYEAGAMRAARQLLDATGDPGVRPCDVDCAPAYLASLLTACAEAVQWCEARADTDPEGDPEGLWADCGWRLVGDAAELESMTQRQAPRRDSPNARLRVPGALARGCAETLLSVLAAMEADGPMTGTEGTA